MEDQDARSVALLRECQVPRDCPFGAFEVNHCQVLPPCQPAFPNRLLKLSVANWLLEVARRDLEWPEGERTGGLHHRAMCRRSEDFLAARLQQFGNSRGHSELLNAAHAIRLGCCSRWTSLPSPGSMCFRSGNVPRTCTGAYRPVDSSSPRSQDFRTALRDLLSWRSTRGSGMYRHPPGRIPGSSKCGALVAPCTSSQLAMWPSSP